MKNTTLIIVTIIALTIGTGAGYSFGKGLSDSSAEIKKTQDAISMMKEQSASIKKMGEMMISSGLAEQEMGIMNKDEKMISMGKDLEAFGKKYVEENAKSIEKDTTMKQNMN
jgi:hypothetical protein